MIDEETENEWKKRPKRQLSLMAGLQFDWLGFRNNIFYSLVESSPVKLETSHTAYSDISPLYVNDL